MVLYKKSLILLTAILFLIVKAESSKLVFDHITLDQGLPVSNVKRIHQDSQGFLWFATDCGLIKYDGYNVKIYKYNPADPNSLTCNNVSRIIESNYGGRDVLWIGLCNGGVCKFDLDTERCTRYCTDPFNPNSIKNGVVWALCESKSEALWIGTFLGIDRLDYKTSQFTHFLGDTCVKALHEDENGILWIGTWKYGLIKLNPETGEKWTYLHNPDDPASISNNNVESIYESDLYGRRILWIGTRRGLNKFDPVTGEFIPFGPNPGNPVSLKEISVYSIFEPTYGKPGELWLTGGPLRIFNIETERYIQFLHDPDDPHSISSSGVNSVCEDKSGVLWIGSALEINKLNRQKKPFKNYQYQPRDSASLSSNIILSIYQDSDGILWIGTSNGLNKLVRETGQCIRFPLYPKNGPRVNAIQEDSLGRLWLGTSRGIIQLDKYNGEIQQYAVEWEGAPRGYRENISSICKDNNNLWFGASSAGGIHKYNITSGSFTHYLRYYRVNDILSRSYISNRYLWLAGKIFGLIKIDKETGHYIMYGHHGGLPGSLSNNRVYTLNQTDSGTIWLGTGNGLNKLVVEEEEPDSSKILEYKDYSTGDKICYRDSVGAYFDANSASMYWNSPQYSFINYTEENGFPSSHVVGILEDEGGHLWLSTLNGISRFDPQQKTFRNYYKSDGLPSNQFIPRACYKNDQGEFFFGTISGLTSFFPDSIKDNTYIPPVVLTDFQLFYDPVPIDPEIAKNSKSGFALPKHISRLDTLKLSYRENVFSIKFAALDYHNPMKNQYAYKLEGFNKDWIYTDASNRTATYTNLDPGEYIFKVKGSNNDGLWNEEGKALKIIIDPPWWRTELAYITYVLMIILVIYAYWRFQLGRIRLKHQVELEHLETKRYHEMNTLKSRFFANISHEFRTPLTLILGPLQKMLKRLRDKESQHDLSLMQKHARRLLSLVSQLLDLSKLEANKMALRTTEQNIVPLIKGLVQSFSSLAERKNIDLTFKSDVKVLPVFVQKDIIVKIINNLLTNAFKFTDRGGSVSISLIADDEKKFAVISVTDTGIGIPVERLEKIFDRFYQVDGDQNREHEGTGIGLSLIKELTELHKGKISVKSKEGEGSTFSVQLPLGKEHLTPKEIIEAVEQSDSEQIKPEVLIDIDSELTVDKKMIQTWDSTWEILIVEDNIDVRNYIRSYLDNDYFCMEAGNGQIGFEKAVKKLPDLIISDIMMPVVDGVEFCRKVKSDERTSHIPVILLTAKADIEDRLDGLVTGADDYLTKPFEARELLIRIQNLIEQRHRLQERFRKEFSIIPDDIILTPVDKKFMDRVVNIIKDNLGNMDFKVDKLSHKAFMSRQHLNRKLKALTGNSAQEFIRNIRLKTAAQLLRSQEATITEIAYRVGFSSPSYFSEQFRLQFACSPSEFTQKTKN